MGSTLISIHSVVIDCHSPLQQSGCGKRGGQPRYSVKRRSQNQPVRCADGATSWSVFLIERCDTEVAQPAADLASLAGKGRWPRPRANDATWRAMVPTVAHDWSGGAERPACLPHA